jgi:hypothetical protein
MADDGYEMVIERGKVREFAGSVKSTNAAYLDDPEPVIPPTFLRAAAFWAPRRAPRPRPEGAQASGPPRGGGGGGGLGLHAGQEYVFYGPPPRAGTKLRITSRQEDQYTKEGRRGGTLTFTVTVQEYRDEEGNLVAIGRNTGVRTSRAANTGAG